MAEPAMYAFVASWITPSSLFIFLNLVIGTIALTSRFPSKKPVQKSELGSHDSPQLVRSSSLLERVRSFNFGLHKYEPTNVETEYIQPVHDSPQLVRTPSLLQRVTSFNFGFAVTAETEHIQPDQPEYENPYPNPPSLLERPESMNSSTRCRSDSIKPDEGSEVQARGSDPDHTSENLVRRSKSETHKGSPAKSSEKMKKSASEKLNLRNFDENESMVEQRRPASVRTERDSRRVSETLFGEEEGVDAKADDFINRFKQQLRLQRLDSLLRYRGTASAN
ncbi:hypothetical protein L6164_013955 [Bauhinia variegata]|uniref:Uncharacterized protein n=1 Tax=Bauhinia variegata TaxID=167791 RepID=A0ACB9NG30_BAUVA|nr:hypothetical protein L6164_013955 [Bauhinia variegata]